MCIFITHSLSHYNSSVINMILLWYYDINAFVWFFFFFFFFENSVNFSLIWTVYVVALYGSTVQCYRKSIWNTWILVGNASPCFILGDVTVDALICVVYLKSGYHIFMETSLFAYKHFQNIVLSQTDRCQPGKHTILLKYTCGKM